MPRATVTHLGNPLAFLQRACNGSLDKLDVLEGYRQVVTANLLANLDASRRSVRALGLEDLWELSDALNAALTAAQADPKFKPWPAVADIARTRPDL